MPTFTSNTFSTTDTTTINAGDTYTWKPLFSNPPPVPPPYKMEETPKTEEKEVYFAFSSEKYRGNTDSIHKKWFGALLKKVDSTAPIPGVVHVEIINWGPLWTAEDQEKYPYGDSIGDCIYLENDLLSILE